MKARISSIDVRAAVLELLKNKRVAVTSSKIHDEITIDVALPRVTNALNQMLEAGFVGCDGHRPKVWFIQPKKPYSPYIATPRIQRFSWTREAYVPPPPPALRAGALDYQRCKSVGTP